MFRKAVVLFCAGFLALNLYGCLALFAGAAGGAGTSIWLSNKMTQEFNVSYDRAVKAAESALKSLNLPIKKESKEEKITQLKSVYTDGKEIWVDIRKVTDSSTKVEVRVGAVNPDKEAATKILKRIQLYL